jgi:hypothetical protein
MTQSVRGKWNRRRFLGAAVGSLAGAPLTAHAEEQDLPHCSREARHGPWKIGASPGDYWIERDTDASGVGNVEIVTYRTEDGPIPMSVGIRVSVDAKNGVDLSARLPRDIRVDDAKYGFSPQGGSGRVHIWRGSDDKAFYVEALMIVDGRKIARGPMSSVDGNRISSIGVSLKWSANPLPAMKAGREAVLLVRAGRDGDPGMELVRMPIDLDGVTAATRKAEELQREAEEELKARECTDSACYLTTACCEHLGRPDACWELQTLRWYRDRILAMQADGTEALATYYRVAPAILAALPACGIRRTWALARIYWGTVIPCALLVRLGAYRLARRRYERTFHRLRSRWLSV